MRRLCTARARRAPLARAAHATHPPQGPKAVLSHAAPPRQPLVELHALVVVRVPASPAPVDLREGVELEMVKGNKRVGRGVCEIRRQKCLVMSYFGVLGYLLGTQQTFRYSSTSSARLTMAA